MEIEEEEEEEEKEELTSIDFIPREIIVEILRFVFADEKELRRGAAPQVSSAWRFRTMEYLLTIGLELEPSNKFLMLRHVAVFRSNSWKILSSLRPKILLEILNEIRSDMSFFIPMGRIPESSIFILKTRRVSVDLIAQSYGSFDLLTTSTRSVDENIFNVKIFPKNRLPAGHKTLKIRPEQDSKANLYLTNRRLTQIVQEYDVILHIAKTPMTHFGLGLIERFFINVERITTGGKTFIGFEKLLSRMLIVSTRVKVSSSFLGTRKKGEEDVKETSTIEGGGEYVYSVKKDEDEGVLVALGSALFQHADSILEDIPGATTRGKSALFKFNSDESTLEQASIFFETTTVFMFNSIEEIRSSVPYDRIFFSDEIPLEDLERLFMIQKKEFEKKAPGEAKMKGGEVFEF